MSKVFEFAIYKADIKQRLFTMLLWLFLSGALLSAGVFLYPAIVASHAGDALAEIMQVFPHEILKPFDLDAIPNLQVYTEYLSVCLQVLFAVGCLYACYLGTAALIRPESDNSVVFDYAQPVSRTCMLLSRFFSQATVLLVFDTGMYVLTLLISQSFVLDRGAFCNTLFRLFALFYLIGFLYLAIGFLFSSFLTHISQASAAALLLFLSTFLFGVCSGVNDALQWMKSLSPYHLFAASGMLQRTSVSGGTVTICLLLSLLCAAAAVVRYRYKDMNV